jgi:hypothetical protein
MHPTARTGLRLAAALAALKASAHAQTIIYVDAAAPPGGDGHAWPVAFADLTDALAAAAAGHEPAEVRIAQGTYTPDQGTGDRLRSFEVRAPSIASGMAIWVRGSFGGLNAQEPDEIDLVKYATVLSGDLNGDDVPGFVNRADNSRRILDVDIRGPIDPRFQIENLVIRGAWGETPDSRGGGLAAASDSDNNIASSKVTSCLFEDNYAAHSGAGAWLSDGPTIVSGCQFFGNMTLGYGGGVAVSAPARFTHCTIAENQAQFGGGLAIDDAGSAEITGLAIYANTATVHGGGLHSADHLRLDGCEVTNNHSTGDGGGAFSSGSAIIERSTIAGNSAGENGGGFFAGAHSDVRTSILTGNHAARQGGGARLGDHAYIFASVVVDNRAATGGGAALIGSGDAEFTSSIFWGNDAPDGPQAAVVGNASALMVRNCDMQGGVNGVAAPKEALDWQPTNIDADPNFTDSDGDDDDPSTWGDNNLRPAPESPCIEAGLDSDAFTWSDLDGYPRVVNADCDCVTAMDIGPYELQAACCPPGSARLFVSASAPPGGDGLSWAGAFRDLNDALETTGVAEVWVAAGTYMPDRGTADRAAAFRINCDVALYGGFAGDEDDLAHRDPAANPTILSGDLHADDAPGGANRADNSRHVVYAVTSNLVIDGFTITGGNASGGAPNGRLGGGVFCDGGDLLLQDCSVVDNISADRGGGLFFLGDNVKIDRCVFEANSVTGSFPYGLGGAAILQGDNVTVNATLFVGNSVVTPKTAYGGAISLDGHRHLITNSVFFANQAAANAGAGGGAIRNGWGDMQVYNCLFTGNVAAGNSGAAGGAIVVRETASAVIVNSTLAHNHAWAADGTGQVGGVASRSPSVTLGNSVLWGNTDASGAGESAQIGAINQGSSIKLNYSLIQSWTGNLGGQGNSGADPLPLDPLGLDGIPATGDEDWRLSRGSPAIDAADNTAIADGIVADLAGANRFIDDPATDDTGIGPDPIADIGAYEFQPPWCADCDGSKTLDAFDFLCFLNQFNAQDPTADCTADDALDLFDFLCFVNAFSSGC